MQIKFQSCVTLFSLHVHKKAFKLNLFFFTECFLIQREFATSFDEISPKELNKCRQKFYLSARKRSGCSVIARAKIVMRSLVTVNELKIIIFVLNYLTVLVYTKTIIHRSAGA